MGYYIFKIKKCCCRPFAYKNKFESIFCSLPKYSHVLLAIGEIDCRLDSGIIQHKKKYPAKQIKEIIRNTVKNYLSYIVVNNSNCQHKIIIQGVPCPTINRCFNHSEKEVKQLIEVIKLFNFELKIRAEEKNLVCLHSESPWSKESSKSVIAGPAFPV